MGLKSENKRKSTFRSRYIYEIDPDSGISNNNNNNSVEKEIQKHILAGNITNFAAISLFSSRLLSRATKILLYKTLIRLVVSYGAETWTVTKKDEQALLAFERKIFRRIYDPKYENGERKSRINRELEEMSKGENIVKWTMGHRIS